MKFTVIIPVYNTMQFLPKCIDSLIHQTFRDFEIILVDDGSTDSSGKMIQNYSKSYPFIKGVHQDNLGLGGARNTGVKKSQGEFLLFVDSDDYLDRKALEILAKGIDIYNADILLFDSYYVDEDGNILNIKTSDLFSDEISLLTNKQYLLMESSACWKVFRRELFVNNQITFPEHLWYEDLATVYKFALIANKIIYIKKPLYYYVQQDSSITHSIHIARFMEIKKAYSLMYEFFRLNDKDTLFYDELEWLGFKHLIYYSAFRHMANGYHTNEMEDLLCFYENLFPQWKENQYLNQYSENLYLSDMIINGKYTRLYGELYLKEKKLFPLLALLKRTIFRGGR